MGADYKLFKKFNYNKIFIETGSFIGGGINQAYHAGFKKVISIEISPHYHDYVKKFFRNQESWLELHLGDSGELLEKIIDKIDEPIVFWLDAHYSGGKEDNVPETGGVDMPHTLFKELEIIKNHKIKTHTILIDDVRLDKDFDLIEKLKKKISSINSDYTFEFASPEDFIPNSVFVAKIN
jgi:hypothetical protein